MKSFHAEKWGPLGAIFAAACCLGFTWLVSLIMAIGVGFLIRDSILLPLMVAFLAVTVWGLSRSYRRHSWAAPMIVGSSGAVLLLIGMFTTQALSLAGIVLLVLAPLLDLYAQFTNEQPALGQPRASAG